MGVLWISRDRDDRRIFLSLKFLIPGFNWVGNISGISFRVFNAFWEFLRLENLTLWGGGGGFVGSPGNFWGFDFCPH